MEPTAEAPAQIAVERGTALFLGEKMSRLLNRARMSAYELFGQRGRANGHDLGDWLQAENELGILSPAKIDESDRDICLRIEQTDLNLQEILSMRYSKSLLTLLLFASSAVADSRYSMIDLGAPHPPGSTFSGAYDINERGQVAVFTHFQSFVWENGQFTALPTHAIVTGLNARGQVVGTYSPPQVGPWQPFLWEEGSFTLLGVPAGALIVHAAAINNRGQVVGWWRSDTSAVLRPFLWENGVFSELSTGGYTGSAEATSISDSGLVAGYITVAGLEQPVVWERGQLTLLGLPAGPVPRGGRARAVNNRGDVLLQTAYGHHIWSKGRLTRLNVWTANGINASGAVACTRLVYDVTGNVQIRPCVWDKGTIIDLPTDLPTLGWIRSDVVAINNRGDLAGYLLDPQGIGRAVIWVRN